MFIGIGFGEFLFLCLVAILTIALPAIVVYLVTKMSKRLDQIEEKLKEKK